MEGRRITSIYELDLYFHVRGRLCKRNALKTGAQVTVRNYQPLDERRRINSSPSKQTIILSTSQSLDFILQDSNVAP